MAVQKIEQQQANVKEALRVCGELGWFGFPPVDLTEAKKTKKGFLVVFEGIDGAGKSTQMEKIKKWLEKKNWHVDVTCWKSSPILGDAITQAKATKKLTPLVFSLLHAADMAWRYELEIKPALEKGHVVLCDRYCYTSYVRDGIRGISSKLLDTIYQDLPKPDVVFHLQVPVRTAVERLLSDKGVKWYSAGMDLGFSKDKEESLTIYEREMDKIYRKILPKLKGYQVISTNRSIDDIFEQIKGILKNLLKIVKD
jgi:dTMP kinase